ncbi:MAG: hypothetical protein ACETWK_13270 [Candidatus Aminicenantaceae bacterium]
MDLSQTYTSYNVYSQPDIVYSRNGFPFVEYFFHGAFLDYKTANFFMKNIGSEGTFEVITSDANDKQTFSIKANTSYVLRIKPWDFGSYRDDLISIKMDQLVFKNTKKPKRNYELIFEEIYSESDTALSDPQNREWFNDTIWI